MLRLLLILLLLPYAVVAQEVELEYGLSVPLSRFDADSEVLVLWLPSDRGFDRDFTTLGQAMAKQGVATWFADLHEAYMIPTGRSSIEEFDPEDVVSLLEFAGESGYQRVVIMSPGRGMRLALRAGRAWQATGNQRPRLDGIATMYPHLTVDGQRLGEDVRYIPEAHAFNLPVYIMLPEYSTKYAHIGEIKAVLEEGGSSVFVHKLPGVQGGFHVRQDEDLTPADHEAAARFPKMMKNAVALIASQESPATAPRLPEQPAEESEKHRAFSGGLQPYSGSLKPQTIKLPEMGGAQVSSDDWRGETVLLNFWATWCGPCVREIPSLGRLQEKLKDKPFRIVSVNIGESEERIREFAKRVPIAFPVLLDEESETARDWNIYAYPSNYLLNPEGEITHAYRGALGWDEPEVVESILSAMEASDS